MSAVPLDPDAVTAALATRSLGRSLRVFRTVDSTNDLLLRDEFAGSAPGTVIVAEEQRAGRGRRGREWTAPPFEALLFSVLLRPGSDAEEASLVNLAAGVAVARAVEQSGGLSLRVRWPNDLYDGERKVCGILSEFRPREKALVVGIGLNVNQTPEGLPPGAASLRTATGRVWAREPLLAAILGRLEEAVDGLARRGFEPLRAEAEARSDLVGRPVHLDLGDRTLRARAVGIGPRGGLLLKEGESVNEYRAGEVVRVLSVEGY